MSWISGRRVEKKIDKVFWQLLVPWANALRQQGHSVMKIAASGTSGSEEIESYYVEYPRDTPGIVAADAMDVFDDLARIWREEDLSDGAELASALESLSERIGPLSDEEGEVSPNIYVMY
jgi:hypothetical protein